MCVRVCACVGGLMLLCVYVTLNTNTMMVVTSTMHNTRENKKEMLRLMCMDGLNYSAQYVVVWSGMGVEWCGVVWVWSCVAVELCGCGVVWVWSCVGVELCGCGVV